MKKQVSYAFSQYEDEARKIEFQNGCPHKVWSTKCVTCGKHLASDHHINCHTGRSFKSENKVAILHLRASTIDFEALEAIRILKQDYDEVVVLVDSLAYLEFYSGIKYVDRVEMSNLEKEIAHMRKYRENDLPTTFVILYPDTNNKEALEKEAKSLKVNIIYG